MFDFKQYKNNLACISSVGRQLTYGELDELAGRVCAHMEPHRLGFYLCSNTVGSVVGYVAFLRNSDAALLLDADMSRESFEDLMLVYRPGYIWAPAESVLAEGADKVLEAEGYALFETGDKTPVADELAVLLATSGSTGSPKLVRLSKENLRSNAQAIVKYLHITSVERPILGLPMNYAYGLSIVNSHLMAGATLLLTESPFMATEFVQFAIDNGFTSFSGVPYAYETIKNLQIWRQKMPSLRTLTQAGGKLGEDLVRFYGELCESTGRKFYVMYGQAEATARMAYLAPECVFAKAGSIGKAIPGGKFTIVDDDGRTIDECGTIGELVYEGPNVSLGYATRREDLLKGDENKGVLHTGDMAFRDGDGFYYIAGRKSRFVKLFGLRICLDHIESLFKPFLRECVCTGSRSGVVIHTTDKDCDTERIIDFLSSRTKIIRKAFVLHKIERIPRNVAGKVMYKELESL